MALSPFNPFRSVRADRVPWPAVCCTIHSVLFSYYRRNEAVPPTCSGSGNKILLQNVKTNHENFDPSSGILIFLRPRPPSGYGRGKKNKPLEFSSRSRIRGNITRTTPCRPLRKHHKIYARPGALFTANGRALLLLLLFFFLFFATHDDPPTTATTIAECFSRRSLFVPSIRLRWTCQTRRRRFPVETERKNKTPVFVDYKFESYRKRFDAIVRSKITTITSDGQQKEMQTSPPTAISVAWILKSARNQTSTERTIKNLTFEIHKLQIPNVM